MLNLIAIQKQKETMKYSVVVVDDQDLLSDAITGMINTFENFEVEYSCRNKKELIDKLKNSKAKIPELVVVNINCPDLNCASVIGWLLDNHPTVKVVALCHRNDEKSISQILKVGAHACLHKDTKKSIFEGALLALVKKGFYNPITINKAVKRIETKNLDKKVVFKKNELEFMRLACSELTYKEIAERMYLSPKTIDGYRDNLFTKLNVKNRVGMVMYALKHKIYVQ